jgi:sulfatase modifying factor 1
VRATATCVVAALGAACSSPAAPSETPRPAPVPSPPPIVAAAPPDAAPPSLPPPDAAPDPDACLSPAPPRMACVPAGPFIRGADDLASARPVATVVLSTYYMDIDEVTTAQYQACVADGRCPKAGPQYVDYDAPTQPMSGVSWFDAVAYCLAQGKHLPTEAEFEKAARGPDGKQYSWGDEPATCERAIIETKAGKGCGLKKRGRNPEKSKPWPVGSRPAGVYGLRDMAGNQYEWVADWASESYAACGAACAGPDPRGPCDGALTCDGHHERVVRGGSWYWPAQNARGSFRRFHVPGNRPFHHFGFRCAASQAEATALASSAT